MKWGKRIQYWAACVAGVAFTAGAAQAGQAVTFNLAWVPQGSTAGVLVAIDKGFYRDVGLDVTAVRGYGGNRTVNEVDRGAFQFGYGDPVSVSLNRANGGKTRMVGAINTRWPAGLCYVEENTKAASLKDLAGKRLGGGAGSPVQNIAPAWLEENKLPRDYLRLVQMDPSVVDLSLIQGRIDLAECWRGSNRAVIQKDARQAKLTVRAIEYADYGLDIYGNGIVTSDELIRKDPEMVRKFVQATYKGYDYLVAHPKETVEIIATQYPMLDRDVLLQQVSETADLIVDKRASTKQLGWMSPERMKKTATFIDRAFKLGGKVRSEDIYTDAFVD